MFFSHSHSYETPMLAQAFNLWVDIHAPIELVFQFLTNEQDLNRWWTSRCVSEPIPGGRLQCVWDDRDKQITGEAVYRQFEPPHRLVVEWTYSNGEAIHCNGEDPRGMHWPALNIYELTLLDGCLTRLHLHDMGVGSDPAFATIREATGMGWAGALDRLKKAAEHQHRQRIMDQQRKILARKRELKAAKERDQPESTD